MVEFTRPRVVGFNHVALEVGDIDKALAFYGRLFRFEVARQECMAFIDLGDQFIALQNVLGQVHKAHALEAAGVTLLDGPFLDFRDPWGNRVEIVGYDNIQFRLMCCVACFVGRLLVVDDETEMATIVCGLPAALRKRKRNWPNRWDFARYDRARDDQKKLGHVPSVDVTHSFSEQAPHLIFHSQLLSDYATIEEMGGKMLRGTGCLSRRVTLFRDHPMIQR
jgi:hypothetical protein